MKNCLIVFAREPQEGKVKTRLEGYLSKRRCLNLYKALLKDSLEAARGVSCAYRILAYESCGGNPGYLKRAALRYIFYKQKGRSLGERMHNAFKFAKAMGAAKTVIIGSDIPHLSSRAIERAFFLLGRSDLVLGPAIDGGYYLIGLKSPLAGLFKGITWSSSAVFEHTLGKAKRLKKTVALLEEKYDIDDKEALLRLRGDLNKPHNRLKAKWTRRALGLS